MQGTSVFSSMVRELAGRLLRASGEERKGLQSKFLWLICDRVRIAAARHLRSMGVQIAEDINARLCGEFLQKASENEFLEKLCSSENPSGYLSVSVRNHFVNYFRTHPVEKTLPESTRGSNDESGGASLEYLGAVSSEEQEEAQARELAARLLEHLHELSQEDRLLFKVAYASVFHFDEDEIEQLARRRGVECQRVRREIEQRAERLNEKETELQQKIERLAVRRIECNRKIRAIEAELHRRGEETPEDAKMADGESVRQLFSSTRKLKSAPTEQLFGALAYLYDVRQKLAEKRQELAKRKSGHALTTRPGWEEVARIIGLIDDDCSQQKIKTAVNTVTVRVTRIRNRLKGKVFEDDDEIR